MSISKHVPTAEKEALLPIVDLMLKCANTARKYGVLALEEFVQNQSNEFLTFATMMVIDGTDPELVKGILETLIAADDHTPAALLERILITEGVLSVQAGENPRILETKLLCILGEDFLRKRGLFPGAEFGGLQHEELIAQRLPNLLDENLPPEYAAFNAKLQIPSNRDIQQILREVFQRDLALALMGCTTEVADKLLCNLTKRLAAMIVDDMELMDGRQNPAFREEILAAQQKIMDIIDRLVKAGEIVI